MTELLINSLGNEKSKFTFNGRKMVVDNIAEFNYLENLCLLDSNEKKVCLNLKSEKIKDLPYELEGDQGVCPSNVCPRCTCEHGEPAKQTCDLYQSDTDDTDNVKCISCNKGFELIDGKCYGCANNYYKDDVGKDRCKPCDEECNTSTEGNSEHSTNIVKGCGGENIGVCESVICKCDKGKPANTCTRNNRNKCSNCDENHYLNDSDQCIECPKNYRCDGIKKIGCTNTALKTNDDKNDYKCVDCPENANCNGSNDFTCNQYFTKTKKGDKCERISCPNGILFDNNLKTCLNCPDNATCNGTAYFTCNSHHIKNSNKCELNQCRCDNGTGAKGEKCPIDNTYKCDTCLQGFRKLNNACIKNICHCNNGTAAENEDCNFEGEKCVSCNDGRYLNNNICSLCTEIHNCSKEEYIEGCSTNNKGKCVKCPVCDKGYYRKDCSGIDPGYCTQYTNCTHGILQNGTPYSDNVCCKPNNCPANHFRASYSCQNGPTCQPYQHCPNGIRHHGTPTTNHVCKQLTHRSQQYGPSYERHLSSEYGNYKYAWILSWREGNWYSYVIWDNKVVLFKNHGGPFNNWPNIWHKTAHVWTSPISWGPRGQRIFKRQDHEHHGGDDFKCTLNKKLTSGNYEAGDPFKNNNGVCGRRGWSSNKTWYYSVWMRDIWTEYA